MTDQDTTLDAYLAGWRGCVDSLKDQSFEQPSEFDDDERDLAENCFWEDYGKHFLESSSTETKDA